MYKNRTIYLYTWIDREYNDGVAHIGVEYLNSLKDSLLATAYSSKTIENETYNSQNICSQVVLNRKNYWEYSQQSITCNIVIYLDHTLFRSLIRKYAFFN